MDILNKAYSWVDGQDERCIFWVSGLAGTGKSTIARTVAHRYYNQQRLAASFFFSRAGSDIGHAGKFVTSIASQFASNVPAVRQHINAAIAKHSDIVSQSLHDQWQHLVCRPLSALSESEPGSIQTTYIVVIDALDECSDDSDICEIVRLLAGVQSSITCVRLRVLLTSRPEVPLLLVADPGRKHFVLHKLLPSIFDYSTELYSEARPWNIKTGEEIYSSRYRNFQPLSELDRQTSYQRCLSDLRVTDPREDRARIEDSKGKLLRDCYVWILDDANFQRWSVQSEPQLLWIKGKSGTGKTMLTMGIIAMRKLLGFSGISTPLLSFFFCQIRVPTLNNAVSVLRGLLYMLVAQQEGLVEYVRRRCKTVGKLLFDGPDAFPILRTILSDMLHDASLPPTYLLIDALDECTTGLSEILHIITDSSFAPLGKIKWLVTSRNTPEIERSLRPDRPGAAVSLEINASYASKAVVAFVEYKVRRLSRFRGHDSRLQEEVKRRLRDKAEGTFFWVSPMCEELEHTPPSRVRRKLRVIPRRLAILYHQMMAQIMTQDEETVKYCKEILQAITFATRPLHLEELAIAAGLPDDLFENSQAIMDLVSSCGSLLNVHKGTVSFVHSSAKDYFARVKGWQVRVPAALEPSTSQTAALIKDSRVDIARSQDFIPVLVNSCAGTRHSSELHTSCGTAEPEGQVDKQNLDTEYIDTEITNSVHTKSSDLETDFVLAFAQRLVHDVKSVSRSIIISKVPSMYINHILRKFSWRLHEESSNLLEWEASVTLQRKRK
ncbi:Vegetative incompatibility protein HET-E-1-like protein 15 [Stagonosporopsis vannaccii]|nr:Vegetative incompatibility protein HET-E-1-like protein 15 [Stagonosporopsis vannaccii]